MILRRFVKHVTEQNWFAVGLDMLVVVTGIFLGMQVTDWNDERNEQLQIEQYLSALENDLQQDAEMLIPVAEQIDLRGTKGRMLAKHIKDIPLHQLSNLDLFLFTTSPGYRPYSWNRATLDQLKNSGAIRKITSPELIKKISDYDALSRHLDLDYTNDEQYMHEAFSLAIKIIDMNYPNSRELVREANRNIVNANTRIQDGPLYKKALSNNTVLLTQDLPSIRAMANVYKEISQTLSSRTSHEIPRLKKYGQEIIELIHQHYPITGSTNSVMHKKETP
ncbi:hypothetical protein QGN29_06905 [Temperatibacter marinus]|uniref:Uncharacterized protein n=1 Tax=Temperatibacter marinus TaxID=1456591 RepID=A0AA52HAZ2_9PROT|nr:hypothetical protein [Temperatibacter marinus]WND04102.1 hypothetical protein QGN29_06905 [Temperatibacter marinus]